MVVFGLLSLADPGLEVSEETFFSDSLAAVAAMASLYWVWDSPAGETAREEAAETESLCMMCGFVVEFLEK